MSKYTFKEYINVNGVIVGCINYTVPDNVVKQIRAEAFDELLTKFEKRTQFLQITRSECIELLRDLAYELMEE